MTEWARTYGDMVYLRLANVDAYLLSHPDLIEEVLVALNRNFIKPRLLRDAGEVLGNGLLTSDGEFWLRQRRLMAPAFHRERIASYGATMVEHTSAMLRGWRDGGTYDIHDTMMHLTLGIVARTLFGADVGERAADVGVALEIALQRFVERMSLMRLLDRLPLPRNRRFRRAMEKLDGIIYDVIEHRRRSGRDEGDLLSLLLQAQDEDGSRMTDTQLRDEVITLFLAGHETTAISLSWTFYLLAQSPEVEERMVRELDDVLGGREPSVDDLPRLRYVEMVVKESMRLYPPAWRVGREAITDCEVGGFPVPAGAQLIMSQWVTHRDARFFDDPLLFRPERWGDEGIGKLPRFAYFPFGGGARKCIGDSFAMMEAILILAAVSQRFHLRLVPQPPIELWPSITLRPRGGIRMEVRRR
jgi:cytochrome P450